MRLAMAVAVLGAAGSLARWLLSTLVQRHAGAAFPAGTLVVNALGSVAIGVVMGVFAARGAESSPVRVALTAGFMGGFTTYSSFALETWLLLERRALLAAAVNVAATLAICIGGCAVGLVAGRAAGR